MDTAPEASATIRTFAAVVLAALLYYGLNVDFLLRGDASMYADYVLRSDFSELRLHIGYYALVWLCDRGPGALLGLPIQETMVWLNVVCGALAMGVAYLLALQLLGTRRDALICALILTTCGRIVGNATMSEIYMLQTLLVLTAFLQFSRGRVVAAGVVGGLALYVSPLSAFAYLFFPVLDYQRHGRVRFAVLLQLSAIGLAVYSPLLLTSANELFYGRRGLLAVDGRVVPKPRDALHNLPVFLFKHYSFELLLLLPLIARARRHAQLLALTAAVFLPHLYVIVKLPSEDHVFMTNADFFFAACMAGGVRELMNTTTLRWLAPLPLLAHLLVIVVAGTVFSFDTHRSHARDMQAVASNYLRPRDSVVMSDWDGGMVLTFYGRPAILRQIEQEPLWRQTANITDPRYRPPQVFTARKLYLLDTWEPSRFNRFVRSDAALARQRRQNALLAKAEHEYGLACTLVGRFTFPFYRCMRGVHAAVPPARRAEGSL